MKDEWERFEWNRPCDIIFLRQKTGFKWGGTCERISTNTLSLLNIYWVDIRRELKHGNDLFHEDFYDHRMVGLMSTSHLPPRSKALSHLEYLNDE